MLTWSLGCTGDFEPMVPPSISMARLEITSLAFMFDWVPEPVCQTTSGKWPSSLPSITSCDALTMVSPTFLSSRPSAMLVSAARSEEHTSELQSRLHLVCRLLLEKKKKH